MAAASETFDQTLFFELMQDPTTAKEAAELGSDFIRIRLREEGFLRKILMPKTVSDSDLVPQVHTDQMAIIGELETDVPMAVNVSMGDVPDNFYLWPRRFLITPNVIESPRIRKDERELRTWKHDVKQLMADNMVKDLQYQEDTRFIGGVDSLLLGQGSAMPVTNTAQWVAISGGWTRENVVEGLTTLQKIPYSLTPERCLANTVTAMNFMKWRRDEAGGDVAEDTLKRGLAETKCFGVDWMFTIKRYLVGDYTFYQFANQKFIGRFVLFQEPTMWVDPKYHVYQFFCDESVGLCLAHSGGLARVDITA